MLMFPLNMFSVANLSVIFSFIQEIDLHVYSEFVYQDLNKKTT